MAVCLCPSHLISVATPCLECVHASVHEFMSTLPSMSGPAPMDSYMDSWVPLCVSACVSQSPYFCSCTLFRMCTCIRKWILCPPGCLCLTQPLCIVWWKPGCPCMTVCLCPSHLISVATPCREFVHRSVHKFMSTCLLISGPTPMHSLMKMWVPTFGSVFVSQLPHFCCHNLV